jgi:hypothetical protein
MLRDGEVVTLTHLEALEIALQSIRAELEKWGEWEPFVHGADDAHPHIYNQTKYVVIALTPTDEEELQQHVDTLTSTAGRCACGEYGPLNVRWSNPLNVRWK